VEAWIDHVLESPSPTPAPGGMELADELKRIIAQTFNLSSADKNVLWKIVETLRTAAQSAVRERTLEGRDMKVYVIMSNDFPDAVFDNTAATEKYIEEKKSVQMNAKKTGPFIYWRSYEFELRSE
jgi:hypothetical protein